MGRCQSSCDWYGTDILFRNFKMRLAYLSVLVRVDEGGLLQCSCHFTETIRYYTRWWDHDLEGALLCNDLQLDEVRQRASSESKSRTDGPGVGYSVMATCFASSTSQ